MVWAAADGGIYVPFITIYNQTFRYRRTDPEPSVVKLNFTIFSRFSRHERLYSLLLPDTLPLAYILIAAFCEHTIELKASRCREAVILQKAQDKQKTKDKKKLLSLLCKKADELELALEKDILDLGSSQSPSVCCGFCGDMSYSLEGQYVSGTII